MRHCRYSYSLPIAPVSRLPRSVQRPRQSPGDRRSHDQGPLNPRRRGRRTVRGTACWIIPASWVPSVRLSVLSVQVARAQAGSTPLVMRRRPGFHLADTFSSRPSTGTSRRRQSSLGYEPYDARLPRPGRSRVAALTLANGCRASTPNPGVSYVATHPAASRAQIRAQIWLLTRDIAVRVIASVSGLLRGLADVRQARPRCLRCCRRVAVMPLSQQPDRARGGHESLRPELAAVLGRWPLSQLTQGVGDSSCLRTSGVVAVLGCCTVTGRTVEGMARVRSGQAPAWPLASGRSVH